MADCVSSSVWLSAPGSGSFNSAETGISAAQACTSSAQAFMLVAQACSCPSWASVSSSLRRRPRSVISRAIT